VIEMNFHETVESVHTIAVSTADGEKIYVLTFDGWRCYSMPPSSEAAG
jgi:hypothetical protein